MGGGYKEAPWIFKGRAIYQLQLVKSEEVGREGARHMRLP